MHVGMQKDPRFHLEDPPRARQVEGGWARPPLPRGSAAMGWQMPEQRGAWGCREPGEDGAGIGAMGRQRGGTVCPLQLPWCSLSHEARSGVPSTQHFVAPAPTSPSDLRLQTWLI